MVKTKVFLFSLILLCGSIARAQEKTVIHQPLIWYGATVQKQFNNGYALSLKAERRDFISPQRQQQLVIPDIKLSKKLNKGFAVDAGLWVFTIYQPALQELPVGTRQYEWRPYFTVHYKLPLDKGSFEFAVKSEYRAFNSPEAENRFDEAFATYAIRERFLLRYNLPLTTNLTARFGEELHLNIAGNRDQGTFDQNRLMGDLVYSIPIKGSNDQLKLHAGYIHWYQSLGNNTFLSHHIINTGVSFLF